MNYFVYLHIKASNNQPFYIGKGKGNRYKDSYKRSKYWFNVVNKHGFIPLILHDNLSDEKAIELEKYYISKFGRKDLGLGPLVNMTDGGDGSSNKVITDEFRKKCSDRMNGNKINLNRKHSDDVNIKKGKKLGENNKAVSVIHEGVLYTSKRELYLKLYQDFFSYSGFINKIKNIKGELNKEIILINNSNYYGKKNKLK
jgi:hypothetical protein